MAMPKEPVSGRPSARLSQMVRALKVCDPHRKGIGRRAIAMQIWKTIPGEEGASMRSIESTVGYYLSTYKGAMFINVARGRWALRQDCIDSNLKTRRQSSAAGSQMRPGVDSAQGQRHPVYHGTRSPFPNRSPDHLSTTTASARAPQVTLFTSHGSTRSSVLSPSYLQYAHFQASDPMRDDAPLNPPSNEHAVRIRVQNPRTEASNLSHRPSPSESEASTKLPLPGYFPPQSLTSLPSQTRTPHVDRSIPSQAVSQSAFLHSPLDPYLSADFLEAGSSHAGASESQWLEKMLRLGCDADQRLSASFGDGILPQVAHYPDRLSEPPSATPTNPQGRTILTHSIDTSFKSNGSHEQVSYALPFHLFAQSPILNHYTGSSRTSRSDM